MLDSIENSVEPFIKKIPKTIDLDEDELIEPDDVQKIFDKIRKTREELDAAKNAKISQSTRRFTPNSGSKRTGCFEKSSNSETRALSPSNQNCEVHELSDDEESVEICSSKNSANDEVENVVQDNDANSTKKRPDTWGDEVAEEEEAESQSQNLLDYVMSVIKMDETVDTKTVMELTKKSKSEVVCVYPIPWEISSTLPSGYDIQCDDQGNVQTIQYVGDVLVTHAVVV